MADFNTFGDDDAFTLEPRKQYRPKALAAMIRLPSLDDKPNDLVEILFTKDEQEWIQKQLQKRHT